MSEQKLVIFGATGNTGSFCLTEAIKSKYRVTVLVRDASRLKTSGGFKIVTGDVTNMDDVRKALLGQNAVLCALGTNNILDPTTVFSQGTRNIVQAMGENNIQRISVCNSAFMFWPEDKVPERMRDVTADHRRQIEILKESAVDWIAVCPPHISNDPATGQYQTAIGSNATRRVSREDLAHFLVRCLEPNTNKFLRQLVGVCEKTG